MCSKILSCIILTWFVYFTWFVSWFRWISLYMGIFTCILYHKTISAQFVRHFCHEICFCLLFLTIHLFCIECAPTEAFYWIILYKRVKNRWAYMQTHPCYPHTVHSPVFAWLNQNKSEWHFDHSTKMLNPFKPFV